MMMDLIQEARAPWVDAPPAWDQQKGRVAPIRYKESMADWTADILDNALPILFDRLSDNQWHRIEVVHAVSQDFGIGVVTLLDNSLVAVSESGLWVALVGDSTPDDAPDETGA